VQKISKFDILVQNSFKYLSKELQIIKELLDTLACNIVKVEVKKQRQALPFPIQNCQKLRQDQCNQLLLSFLTIPQPVWIQTSKGLESKI